MAFVTTRTTRTNVSIGVHAYADYATHLPIVESHGHRFHEIEHACPVLRTDIENPMLDDSELFGAHLGSQLDAYAILATGGFND